MLKSILLLFFVSCASVFCQDTTLLPIQKEKSHSCLYNFFRSSPFGSHVTRVTFHSTGVSQHQYSNEFWGRLKQKRRATDFPIFINPCSQSNQLLQGGVSRGRVS
ncbi:hypothetical protein CEXT_233691 [Caerostris extrusa]|uniref:Secreted protein n=1 Tax=Caerostris extrusa TaxID=172846 RepID=A0AAV4VW70_CAEEX|nr:hypothetical protein CEXT_233691 [Caerostris extrusa]